METELTPVVFRRFRSKPRDIVAVLPYIWEGRYTCSCYMHIGQHSSCGLDIADWTDPVAPDDPDVIELRRELEGAPYHYRFRVLQRMPNRSAIYAAWESQK